ncbi:uncharacterized protein si:dkey-262k9.2 [Fundulus heteroclitus]|uniref:uncharacterized protein si:dkey-262k9.2 n=1 Tax=Fundulus heteroclitus TaxID=8078 RepID=UPI00165A7289|nr:uncharacterized protein si:dkey-262k9.2 [Fundulus heteroclitus]XP_021172115.2 uncharacterized protein si:dkey-262k9.2 [Fundulus heteroclitus]XP_021172116.2 uncharacterized protein si:dkey-262k9.2 [Fundulus heteroclitus]XP_021172117.2 uncharacterized protein si:dkey-262k9.2 [Fundulus heteroclitus]
MMRLLFLCVLLLLPAATVLAEDFEGSADESDDEDIIADKRGRLLTEQETAIGSSHNDESTQESPIPIPIIIAVVVLVALSVIAVVAIMLMKRRKLKQQQGIYSVPVEQNHKEAV